MLYCKSVKIVSGKERLKFVGIKIEIFLFDDCNKMCVICEGVWKWDRVGRMCGVKEEVM